ncbi:HNH endonuclease [Treponema sp. R6D11]
MSTQRYISTSFWDDEWVQTLNLTEKALYLYLLTNTLTNIAGVYKISERRILFDTGLSGDDYKNIFDKFEKHGKAYRISEYIALPKWPKHQKWEEKSKIKDGIISCLQELPKNILKYLHNINYQFDLSLVDKTIIASKSRHSISGGKAKAVKEKSENKCAICGNEGKLIIHHIKPLKDGGTNNIDNLQAICKDCHYKIHMSKKVHISYKDKKGSPKQSKKVPNYSDLDPDRDINSDSDKDNNTKNTPTKNKPIALLSREPKNDIERVDKKWLENYIALYGEQPINPDWKITAPLIKKIIKQVGVDKLLNALDNAKTDNFCIKSGYLLKIILSGNVISRLVNKSPDSIHHIARDNAHEEDADKYFRSE